MMWLRSPFSRLTRRISNPVLHSIVGRSEVKSQTFKKCNDGCWNYTSIMFLLDTLYIPSDRKWLARRHILGILSAIWIWSPATGLQDLWLVAPIRKAKVPWLLSDISKCQRQSKAIRSRGSSSSRRTELLPGNRRTVQRRCWGYSEEERKEAIL